MSHLAALISRKLSCKFYMGYVSSWRCLPGPEVRSPPATKPPTPDPGNNQIMAQCMPATQAGTSWVLPCATDGASCTATAAAAEGCQPAQTEHQQPGQPVSTEGPGKELGEGQHCQRPHWRHRAVPAAKCEGCRLSGLQDAACLSEYCLALVPLLSLQNLLSQSGTQLVLLQTCR